VNYEPIRKIPFRKVLDYFKVKYNEKGNRLLGDGFCVYQDTNIFWSENEKGDVIKYLSKLNNCEYHDAAIELSKIFHNEIADIEKQIPPQKRSAATTGVSNNNTRQLLSDDKIKDLIIKNFENMDKLILYRQDRTLIGITLILKS
jgi:hypothetical protein